eukprot:9498675-Pyramimonas_sp.AAC.1
MRNHGGGIPAAGVGREKYDDDDEEGEEDEEENEERRGCNNALAIVPAHPPVGPAGACPSDRSSRARLRCRGRRHG